MGKLSVCEKNLRNLASLLKNENEDTLICKGRRVEDFLAWKRERLEHAKRNIGFAE